MRNATRFAYLAALLFAAHLATYFIPALRDATLASAPTLAIAVALLAIAQHAVVFPVAAALPAPNWARVSAYVWLLGDIISDLLQMTGAPVTSYLTLRLVVNLLAAVWIGAASWQAPRAMLIIGAFVAFDLAAYTFTAPFNARAFLLALPSLVLLPLWFALAGQRLAHLAHLAGAATAPTAQPIQ